MKVNTAPGSIPKQVAEATSSVYSRLRSIGLFSFLLRACPVLLLASGHGPPISSVEYGRVSLAGIGFGGWAAGGRGTSRGKGRADQTINRLRLRRAASRSAPVSRYKGGGLSSPRGGRLKPRCSAKRNRAQDFPPARVTRSPEDAGPRCWISRDARN